MGIQEISGDSAEPRLESGALKGGRGVEQCFSSSLSRSTQVDCGATMSPEPSLHSIRWLIHWAQTKGGPGLLLCVDSHKSTQSNSRPQVPHYETLFMALLIVSGHGTCYNTNTVSDIKGGSHFVSSVHVVVVHCLVTCKHGRRERCYTDSL